MTVAKSIKVPVGTGTKEMNHSYYLCGSEDGLLGLNQRQTFPIWTFYNPSKRLFRLMATKV